MHFSPKFRVCKGKVTTVGQENDRQPTLTPEAVPREASTTKGMSIRRASRSQTRANEGRRKKQSSLTISRKDIVFCIPSVQKPVSRPLSLRYPDIMKRGRDNGHDKKGIHNLTAQTFRMNITAKRMKRRYIPSSDEDCEKSNLSKRQRS